MARLTFLLLASFVAVTAGRSQGQYQSANTGIPSGTAWPALDVAVGPPDGIASDAHGTIYFSALNLILKLDRRGSVSRVAGDGHSGYRGDGGRALEARLARPTGLAFDSLGNLYITDTFNNRVRKINPQGTIVTIAGTGVEGTSGDGGPATLAQLAQPSTLAINSRGDIFVLERGADRRGRVRRIAPSGAIVTVASGANTLSFADHGPASTTALDSPRGLAIDRTGALLILERNWLRRLTPDGRLDRIAGTAREPDNCSVQLARATEMPLCNPMGLATDAAGNIYVSHLNRSRGVLKLTPDGTMRVMPLLPSPLTVAGELVVAADGRIFVGDEGRRQILSIVGDQVSVVAGNGVEGFSGDGGPAIEAQLTTPYGVAIHPNGSIYISDNGNGRIRRVGPDRLIETMYRRSGSRIAFDPRGVLHVAGGSANIVWKVDAAGAFIPVAGTSSHVFSGDGGPATDAGLYFPAGMAFDRRGDLYIADTCNHRIRKVSASSGIISTVAGSGPASECRDGGFAGDGGPAVRARLNQPSDVAVDQWGNIYIADTMNHRIRKVDITGIITTFAGNGETGANGEGVPGPQAQLNEPRGVAVDGFGNVYATSTMSSAIRRISPAGTITTLIGYGRGVTLTSEELRALGWGGPWSLTLDRSGNILFTTPLTNRVQRLSPNGSMMTVAGTALRIDRRLLR